MQSLHISSSALRGMQQALDSTSNNLANLDTIGYKRRGATFSELLHDSMEMQPDKDRENRTTPFGLRVGSGVKVGMTRLDTSQGSAKITEVPTDLMIDGDGYFLVRRMGAIGQADEYALTRNGAFSLQQGEKDGVFTLVNSVGDKLADEEGVELMLTIPPGADLMITPEGRIFIGGEDSNLRIPIVAVPNPDQYRQVGDNEFILTIPDNAINPTSELEFTNYQNPFNLVPFNEQKATTIQQGALEASNVNMTVEMAQLINVQRAYQLNSRAIVITDSMMGIANSLRNR